MTSGSEVSESRENGSLRPRGAGLLRISLALAVAAALYLTGGTEVWTAYLAAALAVVYGGAALAYRAGYAKVLSPAAVFVDVALISLLVAGTGGVGSPFSGLYLLAALGGRSASPAALAIAGYLAAVATPAALAGSLPALVSAPLLAKAGLQIALIALAFYLATRLGSRLRQATSESGARAVSLASEKCYIERLETAISRLERPLSLLRPEDILRWTVDTARETVEASYVHAALLESNLHRTTVAGEAESWPSWWHPDVQRLVLRSSRSGEALWEQTNVPGMEEILAIPMLAGEGPGAGALLVGGGSGSLGEAEKRVLNRLALEAARALSGREQAPGGRDPVSELPNRASLARVLRDELRCAGRLTLLRVELEGFGRYCEVYGLAVGEELLRRLGARMSAGQHRVFHATPDELTLLIGGNEARVRRAALGAREIVRETSTGAAVPLTARVGVAPISPREAGESPHEALVQALDEAGRALERARREPDGVAYAGEPGTEDMEERAAVDPGEVRGIVSALVAAAEGHDAYLGEHLRSVSRLARALGRQLGLSDPSLETLATGALLHDVGKIGLPQELLQKPGSLKPTEYEEIKRHPELGVEILKPIESLSSALPVVKHHHERYDGHGYPDGLSGDEIPLEARITLVADALDSMIRNRAYREGTSLEVATREIAAGSGSQFDPEVVSALLSLLDAGDGEIRLAT